MDPTLKTRIIAALRESARCARSPEQQNEALALVEALCVEDMTPNVVVDLGGAGDGAPVAPDALRKAAQAEVDAAEQSAYNRDAAPAGDVVFGPGDRDDRALPKSSKKTTS